MNNFCEEPFSIKNNDGLTVYGIIHNPDKPNGGLVVMFNIGLHYRVGHSRLFVRQARHMQAAGFTVARLDTSHIGYSHGEMPVGRAIDTYDSVQTGLFKDDAVLAIRYLIERFAPRKTFLTGLCGGALTAIIAASMEKRVSGVVFIAGPVTVTSPEYELKTMHPVDADILFSGYLRRLFSPRAWANFLTGKTSYGDLINSVKTKIKDRLSRRRKDIEIPDSLTTPESENKGDIFNGVFLRAFDTLMKEGRRIQFIMPELDRATYDFDRMFARPLNEKYASFKKQYDVDRVPKADHTFSRPESSRKLFELCSEWLSKRLYE